MSALRSLLLASLFSADLPEQRAHDLLPGLVGPSWQQPGSRDDHAVLLGAQAAVEGLLGRLALPAEVHGRVKSPESLAAKALRKGLAPDEVLDRLALRVVLEDVAACDTVAQALRARYPLVPGSADDYIRNPKANGYQSLHMALHAGLQGEIVEVQVRTAAMHAHAEHGDAAHDAYKANQWEQAARLTTGAWLVA